MIYYVNSRFGIFVQNRDTLAYSSPLTYFEAGPLYPLATKHHFIALFDQTHQFYTLCGGGCNLLPINLHTDIMDSSVKFICKHTRTINRHDGAPTHELIG